MEGLPQTKPRMNRPALRFGGQKRAPSYEFDPLDQQMDHVTTTDEERQQCRLIVTQQVVLGRLSKTGAREILLALGLT